MPNDQAGLEQPTASPVEASEVGLNRDVFLRSLLRELAGTLEGVVGLEEASGYISVVGGAIGAQIDNAYKRALRLERLSRAQVGQVLVDLKRRIEGDFYVIEENSERIVLGNHKCPFGEKVVGRPSMCMMTSNVFGYIASENLGYAKVALEETIARGDAGCRIVIYLNPTAEIASIEGREYARLDHSPGSV